MGTTHYFRGSPPRSLWVSGGPEPFPGFGVPSSRGSGCLPGTVNSAYSLGTITLLCAPFTLSIPTVLVTPCLVWGVFVPLWRWCGLCHWDQKPCLFICTHKGKMGGNLLEHKIQLMVRGFFSIYPLFIWKEKICDRKSPRAVTSPSSVAVTAVSCHLAWYFFFSH